MAKRTVIFDSTARNKHRRLLKHLKMHGNDKQACRAAEKWFGLSGRKQE